LLSAFCFLQTKAQEQTTISYPPFRIGFEAGVDAFFGKINKPERIRENQSYYYDEDLFFFSGFVDNYKIHNFLYLSIKPEYTVSKRFAISVGVRFAYNKVLLSSNRDCFLWRINETETKTDYVRIKNIKQDNYYIGIPLQIKFFPSEKDYFVRHYFVLGTALNFLVASPVKVTFKDKKMNIYASQVLSQIGKPSIFQGYLFGGIGLKIGNSKYPFGIIELHLNYMYGKNNEKTLANNKNKFGLGVQTTLQIPTIRKKQFTYTVND
jgi:hypothetical protein